MSAPRFLTVAAPEGLAATGPAKPVPALPRIFSALPQRQRRLYGGPSAR